MLRRPASVLVVIRAVVLDEERLGEVVRRYPPDAFRLAFVVDFGASELGGDVVSDDEDPERFLELNRDGLRTRTAVDFSSSICNEK